MKATLLKLTTLLLILAGIAASCKPEVEPDVNVVELRQHYPINIPFEEYSLEGTSCQWTNLPYDEKVIIINSNEELEKYITCTGKNYPEIDFTKNTLLLVSGKANNSIAKNITGNLIYFSADTCILYIEIDTFDFTGIEPWRIAYIVKKLNKESYVELQIGGKRKEICQTWVLIEKEINHSKELMPEDDKYPITLTFYPAKEFRGRHDANVYEGTCQINKGEFAFTFAGVTDVYDIDWFLNYVKFELVKMTKATFFLHDKDKNYLQLLLSNKDGSIKLNFINKIWFEETYFELEEWYNF